jgi:hypothetical protein
MTRIEGRTYQVSDGRIPWLPLELQLGSLFIITSSSNTWRFSNGFALDIPYLIDGLTTSRSHTRFGKVYQTVRIYYQSLFPIESIEEYDGDDGEVHERVVKQKMTGAFNLDRALKDNNYLLVNYKDLFLKSICLSAAMELYKPKQNTLQKICLL